eukprot:5059987-Pleurochrysis_carterae.AAC.2
MAPGMPEGSAAGRGLVEAEAAGRSALPCRQRHELRQRKRQHVRYPNPMKRLPKCVSEWSSLRHQEVHRECDLISTENCG